MSAKTIVIFVGRRVPKCLTEISADHFGSGTWMFRCEVNDHKAFEKWAAKMGKSFMLTQVEAKS